MNYFRCKAKIFREREIKSCSLLKSKGMCFRGKKKSFKEQLHLQMPKHKDVLSSWQFCLISLAFANPNSDVLTRTELSAAGSKRHGGETPASTH
jgi:hypothetical protein